ncbi:hypothetical protein Ciccas_003952 [Cichlidogyrus casuarinus]|uniref:Capsid protein n=1 Tax=Cichlidogyrus casuarinus TaxID=1844966 RepID=A0ABD2QCV6_9PLAT
MSNSKPQFCDRLNMSVCEATEPKKGSRDDNLLLDVIVTNPLGWALAGTWIKIPIFLTSLEKAANIVLVNNATGMTLPWQVMRIDDSTSRIPERKHIFPAVQANYHLFFNTLNPIPAMGSARFTLSIAGQSNLHPSYRDYGQDTRQNVAWRKFWGQMKPGLNGMSHRPVKLRPFDPAHPDRLLTFTFNDDPLRQEFYLKAELRYYEGSNQWGNATGAYIFNPLGPAQPINQNRPNVSVSSFKSNQPARTIYAELLPRRYFPSLNQTFDNLNL